MSVIFKYPIQIKESFEVQLTVGARILHVDCQDGNPVMWVHNRFDDPASKPTRFRVYGTGHHITDDMPLFHIATFQQPPFVWHLFMEGD